MIRSPNSNMHSKRKRPFGELSTASDRRSSWPFRQHIRSLERKSTASRTSSASKTPAFSRVTWSSLHRLEKPGSRRANWTTPRMAGENESPSPDVDDAEPDSGFSGQLCGRGRRDGSD